MLFTLGIPANKNKDAETFAAKRVGQTYSLDLALPSLVLYGVEDLNARSSPKIHSNVNSNNDTDFGPGLQMPVVKLEDDDCGGGSTVLSMRNLGHVTTFVGGGTIYSRGISDQCIT